MILGATVTLTNATTDYNLMSVILKALGYSPGDLTKVPDVQVAIDGTLPFFPSQVRSFTITNGAGNLTIKDANKKIIKVLATTVEWIFTVQEASIFLDQIYFNTDSAGSTPRIAVETS
jgi:hypothetical protein